MGSWTAKLLIGLIILTWGGLLLAEEPDGRRRTTIDFEDELIEGEAAKPELLYLLQQRQFNYKRLIRLRENFVPEMQRTAEDVPRGRSGD